MKNNYEYHTLSTPVTLQAHNGSLLTQTKDILGPYLDKDLKNIVDHNYVSDKFISIDKSKHNILFAGCSVTVGCGLDTVKKTWAYKLYEYISKDKSCSGFFNVSLSGGSASDIMLNVLKYIGKYGSPDYIFMMFPNYGRDFFALNGEKHVKNHLFNLYSIIEDICKRDNIKLFTTGWSDIIDGITHYITIKPEGFDQDVINMFSQSFNSYFNVDKTRVANNTFWYIENVDKSLTIIGNDNSHPSEAVHHAWFKEFQFQLEKKQIC